MQTRNVILIAIIEGVTILLFISLLLRTNKPVTPTASKPMTPTIGEPVTPTIIKPVTPTTNTARPGWRLVFDDEFDTPHLDTHKWQTQFWYGRIPPLELQYYAEDAFTFADSILHITAKRRTVQGKTYTSGLISSQDRFTFTYGYAEIRAQVPRGKGLLPAFWLVTNGTIQRPEIDVFEVLGDDPQTVYTTLHYRDSDGTMQEEQHSAEVPDLSSAFHTFAVEWNPTAIIWFVDGVECYRITEHIPDEQMYLIANLAVGGTWPGNPDASTTFPATYAIDYIRVYQQ